MCWKTFHILGATSSLWLCSTHCLYDFTDEFVQEWYQWKRRLNPSKLWDLGQSSVHFIVPVFKKIKQFALKHGDNVFINNTKITFRYVYNCNQVTLNLILYLCVWELYLSASDNLFLLKMYILLACVLPGNQTHDLGVELVLCFTLL